MAMAPIQAANYEPRPAARTMLTNSVANVIRVAATALVSILLPPYLTHHLPVKTYGAWVLILQLSAYVGYLDFGVQTALAKHIAEYEARRDYAGCGKRVSVGLAIMLAASTLGILLTLLLAWRVPDILSTMPHSLYHDVRLSVLFVGASLSISLTTSVFVGMFLGLQRYRVPMVVTIISRLLFGTTICAVVAFHGSLAMMGAAAASVNIVTALLQVGAWRKLASHIKLSLRSIDRKLLQQMLNYCAALTVWSVCALLISGLDITIVGHYSFAETAYYAIANAPTSFMLTIVAALMGPLLPAASALSVQRNAAQMGNVLLRSTRFATMLLLLTGLPFLIGGYFILRLWVGPLYALHSLLFLRILVLANMVRLLCSPYSAMAIATSRQWVASASPVSEGVVNLVSSIWLVQHIGALGVAVGTLLGAVVGVAVHFGVSMRYTQSVLGISRKELALKGMVAPAAMAIPAILLGAYWRLMGRADISLQPCVWCGVATLLSAWCVSMNRADRERTTRFISDRVAMRYKRDR